MVVVLVGLVGLVGDKGAGTGPDLTAAEKDHPVDTHDLHKTLEAWCLPMRFTQSERGILPDVRRINIWISFVG